MNNNINIADYRTALECMICEIYKLHIPKYVKVEKASIIKLEPKCLIENAVLSIFDKIGAAPVKFVAYSKECDLNGNLITSPHDYILSSGETFSIKCNGIKSSSFKVAPRVIGQAGYNVLNSYFGKYYGKKIETQKDIKELFYDKIDMLLPIFLEKTFVSDYTVFIQLGNENDYTVVERNKIEIINFDKQDLEFTRSLDEWNESNSLKYKGVTIAEVQTHKYRTFKFRFVVRNILKFIYD